MSNQGTGFRRQQTLVDNPQENPDFNEFLSSAYGQSIGANRDKFTQNQIYKEAGTGKITNFQTGEDITGLYNNFLSFVANKKQKSIEREQYLAAISDKPGRSGTVLTGLASNANKQILGAPSAPTYDIGSPVLGR